MLVEMEENTKFCTRLVLTQFTQMTSSSSCWFRELWVHRLGSVTVRKCCYPARSYSRSFPSAGEIEPSREDWASVCSSCLKTVPHSDRTQSWQCFPVSQCIAQYFKPAKEPLSPIILWSENKLIFLSSTFLKICSEINNLQMINFNMNHLHFRDLNVQMGILLCSYFRGL